MGKKKEMNFDEWLALGIDNKWCHYPVCQTHDGIPITVDEEFELDEGHDPCIHVVRLFDTPEAWDEGDIYMNKNIRHRMPYQIE